MNTSYEIDVETADVLKEICSDVGDFIIAQINLHPSICEKIGFISFIGTIIDSLFMHNLITQSKIHNKTIYELFKSINLDERIKEISDEIEYRDKHNV